MKRSDDQNIWIYAPGEGAKKWDEFYKRKVIGIGWDELENFNNYKNEEALHDELKRKHKKNKTQSKRACWDFYKVMKPGDLVLAKKGCKKIIGYGFIKSDYRYEKKEDDKFPHLRTIKWIEKLDWEPGRNLPRKTLTKEKHKDFIEEIKTKFNLK